MPGPGRWTTDIPLCPETEGYQAGAPEMLWRVRVDPLPMCTPGWIAPGLMLHMGATTKSDFDDGDGDGDRSSHS